MQQLVEMILTGGLRLPILTPELIALDQSLAKTDIMALLMIHRRGEVTMSELAADLGVPLSTTTGIGARLTRRGLIERERSAQDRRVIVSRLTPAGADLAAMVQAEIDRMIDRITGALTPDEVAQLMHLIQKVIQAFQADEPSPAPSQGAEETKAEKIPVD